MRNMPYVARAVAALTLKGLCVDVGPPLTEKLTEEFGRLLQERRWNASDKPRMSVMIKLLAELVNFRVAAPSTMFGLIRGCLDDFDRSIELACIALDICGHFLYRNSESKESITQIVEVVFKMKNSKSDVKPDISMMVDNAYNACKPPVLVNREVEQKPVMHQYIERLLFVEIGTMMSADKVS